MRPRSVSDDDILEAARACLLAHGPAVSMSVIGKKVGISGPGVLKRFGSKEELVVRALLSEVPPDLSRGPQSGPLAPQLVALLLSTERRLRQAAPRLATLRAGGVTASKWIGQPRPRLARRSLRGWLEQAQRSHGLAHPDLETAADLLISLVEARGFLSWVEPTWVDAGTEWAARAVTAVFGSSLNASDRSLKGEGPGRP